MFFCPQKTKIYSSKQPLISFLFLIFIFFFLFINLYTAGISKNPKPTPMSCGVGKQSRVERGHQRQHNNTHPKAASCI